MLVLTRKQSEMIRIGDDIFVKVIRTGRGTVKIGIQAPVHVRVLRAELCENSRRAQKGDAIECDPNDGIELDPNGTDLRGFSDDELEPPRALCSDQFPHPCFA